ncbi:glutaminase A [Alkalihalophilus pseudofirmus]|uniref:glutaminase A n=1 Tax=Alkalihalophilus pseudofirmus TaxID=79885 RepID=UPI000952236A|nr:glutaminase A [Alkalihalophilus pseudofirmus]
MNQIKEDIKDYLEKIIKEEKQAARDGKIPEYIEKVDNEDHGAVSMAMMGLDGRYVQAGDDEGTFSIQSISKIISLAVALMDQGEEEVFKHVGKEPTGDPYHSLSKMELQEDGGPLNPMVNAGAIAVVGQVKGSSVDEKFGRILDLTRKLAGNEKIDYNPEIVKAEGHDLNRALFYYNRYGGYINEKHDLEDVLPVYWRMTSIEMNIKELSRIAAVIANYGVDIETGEELIPRDVVRVLKTFMVTCGMYDQSGAFAVDVGIPAKSGISGGIMAAIPGRMGIGVLGPDLNEHRNSIAGIRLLRNISERWNLSLFNQ